MILFVVFQQPFSHQAMHIPTVSQESTSYGERSTADRSNTAVQQAPHALQAHQQVSFHPSVMAQPWRSPRPQQTFGNTGFGHQSKPVHGYSQHQNTSFQSNRQLHQGSSHSKQQHNKQGHKKYSNKQQHHRNEMQHAQIPYASTGGPQIHAQAANATLTNAQPFAASVAPATGSPVAAANTYYVAGEHMQGNKSSGDYYSHGAQNYRAYSSMNQAPHSAANSRSQFS